MSNKQLVPCLSPSLPECVQGAHARWRVTHAPPQNAPCGSPKQTGGVKPSAGGAEAHIAPTTQTVILRREETMAASPRGPRRRPTRSSTPLAPVSGNTKARPGMARAVSAVALLMCFSVVGCGQKYMLRQRRQKLVPLLFFAETTSFVTEAEQVRATGSKGLRRCVVLCPTAAVRGGPLCLSPSLPVLDFFLFLSGRRVYSTGGCLVHPPPPNRTRFVPRI